LFDYIQQEEEVVENEPSTATEEPLQEDIEVTRQKSQYGYFKSLLEKFDSETFKTPDYPKKCEKSNQPVALTTRQIADLSRTDYGIGDLPQLETSSPDGVFICPEYWCMTDNLPLRETQLVNSKCPVCNGKIQTNSRQNKFEYSVIKRPESSKYPRYINNYFSTTSGRELPCCFSTNKPKKLTGENLEDKFYILSELKNNLKELRLSFIPQYYIDTLQLEIFLDIAKEKKSDYYNLNSLVSKYKINKEKSHTAAGDTLMTKDLVLHHLNQINKLIK
jgi:hypothetical protein